MKNYLRFCCFFVCLFLITGCGGKTLKCSRENNSPDEKTKIFQELNVTFKGDSASNLLFKMNVSIDDELIASNSGIVDSLADSASSEFDNIKDERGVSYSISKKEKGFDSKLKLNFNKMNSDIKKKVYLINQQGTYSVIKSELEKQGYSCK